MRAKILVSGTLGAALFALPSLASANTRPSVPVAVSAEVTRANTRTEAPDTNPAELDAPSPHAGAADPIATKEGARRSKPVKRRFNFLSGTFLAAWAAVFGGSAADTFLNTYDSAGAG